MPVIVSNFNYFYHRENDNDEQQQLQVLTVSTTANCLDHANSTSNLDIGDGRKSRISSRLSSDLGDVDLLSLEEGKFKKNSSITITSTNRRASLLYSQAHNCITSNAKPKATLHVETDF